jgi:hypothetical protein
MFSCKSLALSVVSLVALAVSGPSMVQAGNGPSFHGGHHSSSFHHQQFKGHKPTSHQNFGFSFGFTPSGFHHNFKPSHQQFQNNFHHNSHHNFNSQGSHKKW